MSGKRVRIILVALTAFTGIAAVAGGIGLIVGGIQPPTEWLQGSPFSSYVIPGLALSIIIGGLSFLSAGLVLIRHPLGALASLTAGLALILFEIVEFAVIHYASWLQPLFFVVGLVIVGLAGLLWWAGRRRPAEIGLIPEAERQLTGSSTR